MFGRLLMKRIMCVLLTLFAFSTVNALDSSGTGMVSGGGTGIGHGPGVDSGSGSNTNVIDSNVTSDPGTHTVVRPSSNVTNGTNNVNKGHDNIINKNINIPANYNY